jgi:tetraacyldisaccharide 4'-kinase
MSNYLQDFWQKMSLWHRLLYPTMWVFQMMIRCRKFYLQCLPKKKFNVPIIVVGNLTTGGTGKTPLVIALIQACQEKGLAVGVVSRGYKASCKHFPHEVSSSDSARTVGDEPFLIAKKTGVPVVIDPDRVAAIEYLLVHHKLALILSDDGLQHYRMPRSIEIVVLDGLRLLGNQHVLPVGPLREPASRLKTVDFIVVNGGVWPGAYGMHLEPETPRLVKNNQIAICEEWTTPVMAYAGIGNPQRFFQTLNDLSIQFEPRVFPDHYAFSSSDFKNVSKAILMTEKDAVKCGAFATDSMYFLPIKSILEQSFWDALWAHPTLKDVSQAS